MRAAERCRKVILSGKVVAGAGSGLTLIGLLGRRQLGSFWEHGPARQACTVRIAREYPRRDGRRVHSNEVTLSGTDRLQ